METLRRGKVRAESCDMLVLPKYMAAGERERDETLEVPHAADEPSEVIDLDWL